jgi:hypothetical protein
MGVVFERAVRDPRTSGRLQRLNLNPILKVSLPLARR